MSLPPSSLPPLSSSPLSLPQCFDCKYGDGGHPCQRADGSFDFDKVGAAIVARNRAFREDGSTDEIALEETNWVSDCAYEITQDYPDVLFRVAIAAMDACQTPNDAAVVAAGLLEDAVTKHGPALIGHIETVAARSAKFRYFLSAIWGENHTEPQVWQRVCAAVGQTGRMDTDGRGPWDGQPITVLTPERAAELIRTERVSDAINGV